MVEPIQRGVNATLLWPPQNRTKMSVDKPEPRGRYPAWSVLVLLVVLMGAIRSYSYHETLEMDACTYAVIAREMLAGEMLYVDIWDHKPPAIYLTYAAAQVIFGYGPAHTFALGWLAASLTLVGVYSAALRLPGGRKGGLLAASLWALVSADPMLLANQPNSEVFINALIVWAFALLLGLGPTPGTGRLLAIGGLLALASLYKPVVVALGGMLFAAHVAFPGEGRSRRRAVADTALVAAVGAGAWIATFVSFAAAGHLPDAWDAIVTFNRHYAGSLLSSLVSLPGNLLPDEGAVLLPLVLACLWGIVAGRPRLRRDVVLLLAFGIGTAIAIALPGRFHVHYYQLWIPVLCIGAGTGLSTACASYPGFRKASPAVATCVLALLLVWQVAYMRLSPDQWTLVKQPRLAYNRALARQIDRWLPPGQTFLQWGHHAELYYYTTRRPPAGELRAGHLFHGARTRERATRMLGALRADPPVLVLTTGAWTLDRRDHPVVEWIRRNYVPWDPPLPEQLRPPVARFYIPREGVGWLDGQSLRQGGT